VKNNETRTKSISLLSDGNAYGKAGNMEEAIKYFIHAVDTDPNYTEAQFTLATAYQFTQQFDEAIKNFEILLMSVSETNQFYIDSLCSLSQCLITQYFYKENEFTSIEEIFTEENRLIFQKAFIHSKKALELGAKYPETFLYHVLSMVYLGKGKDLFNFIVKNKSYFNEQDLDPIVEKLAKLGSVYLDRCGDRVYARWFSLAAQSLKSSNPNLIKLNEKLEIYQKILYLCEADPDKGLTVIKNRKSSNLNLFFKYCKATAFGRKALHDWDSDSNFNFLVASKKEILNDLKLNEIDFNYLESALNEIREIEEIDPNYLLSKVLDSEFENENFFPIKIDIWAICLERVKPGRVQQILKKTKLKYFGLERIKILPKAKEYLDNSDDFQIYGDIFFNIVSDVGIPRSVLIVNNGIANNSRKYISCIFYKYIFDILGPEDTIDKAEYIANADFYENNTYESVILK
jgi:tetratricopeptide (TPR) repeat protein